MKALRKPLSLFMAMLMCLGIFAGTGTTAFAAGETMTTYMVEFPRASDPNKAGWGHSAMNFLGGWSTGENNGFTIHTQDSFNGKVIYCIEPGVGVHSGDQFTGRGEDFWDDYPSDLNPTIPPDTIKEYIGRIMTYGWQGNASTSWMTDDPEDASKMAGAIATQLLVWETVVGERDSQFNHVDANAQGKNNIAEYISPENPIYNEIFSQYSAIESAVKRHTMLPSFFSSTADAGAYELKWDGQQYSLTLTDTNGVLGDYTFTSNITGLNFSVDGNQLTITSSQAIKGSVTVKAEKISAQRSGVVVWTDGITGGGKQDFATYGETVSDQMVGYLNLEVKTGNMKLIKTSEDGQVAGISFTITGEGYSATKTTNEAGEIDISDLNPGVYTVTEQSIDKYEPQETQRVTIVSGQTATVNFNNKLKRGSLEVTKTSEDGLVEGMTFHLYGTSLSGQPVDEYAVTDSSGVARFENVLIGSGYVLEEVDTPIRYVVPDSQTATIEWNEVTHKSVNNVLKKFRVTVTKSDVETGAPQGDGSLAGAVYGLYKGDTLIDSFTTDENGQFTTGYYVCDSDWTIREISPSEGYLLDSTIHKVGAEPELYEIELNDTSNDVTEQVIKGDIAIIKHTDDGETQIETPESGAEFQVFLKSAGSYENAKESERDVQDMAEHRNENQEDQSDDEQIPRQCIQHHSAHFIEVFRNISSGKPHRKQTDVGKHVDKTSDQRERQIERRLQRDRSDDQHHADPVEIIRERRERPGKDDQIHRREEVAPDQQRPAEIAERPPAVPQIHDRFEQPRRRKLQRRQQEAEPLNELVLQPRRILMQLFRDFARKRTVRRIRKEVESLHERRQHIPRNSEPCPVQPAPDQRHARQQQKQIQRKSRPLFPLADRVFADQRRRNEQHPVSRIPDQHPEKDRKEDQEEEIHIIFPVSRCDSDKVEQRIHNIQPFRLPDAGRHLIVSGIRIGDQQGPAVGGGRFPQFLDLVDRHIAVQVGDRAVFPHSIPVPCEGQLVLHFRPVFPDRVQGGGQIFQFRVLILKFGLMLPNLRLDFVHRAFRKLDGVQIADVDRPPGDQGKADLGGISGDLFRRHSFRQFRHRFRRRGAERYKNPLPLQLVNLGGREIAPRTQPFILLVEIFQRFFRCALRIENFIDPVDRLFRIQRRRMGSSFAFEQRKTGPIHLGKPFGERSDIGGFHIRGDRGVENRQVAQFLKSPDLVGVQTEDRDFFHRNNHATVS